MNRIAPQFDTPRLLADTFVRRVEVHEELGSTSDRALELAADDSVETPLLVLAERQTGGRGRGTNRWWSGPGGLTFSLVLATEGWELTAERRPMIALTAGLAVCETVRKLLRSETGVIVPPWAAGGPLHETDIRLKWPNDVLLGTRKLCGILVESRGAQSPRVVVGIGLNVNNSLDAAPPDVQARAVALCDAHGDHYDRCEVLVSILRRLERRLDLLRDSRDELASCWHEFCALTGRIVEIETAGRRVVGRCAGIAPDGALLIQTESGSERIVSGVVIRYE